MYCSLQFVEASINSRQAPGQGGMAERHHRKEEVLGRQRAAKL